MKNKPKQLKKKDTKMFFFHIKKLKHIPNTKIGDGEKKKKDKKACISSISLPQISFLEKP